MNTFRIHVSLLLLVLIGLSTNRAFDIFQPERLYIYNFTGTVEVGARNPDASLRPTNWNIKGLIHFQRIDSTTVAAWITPHGEMVLNPTRNAEDSPRRLPNLDELRVPYKVITGNGAINYVAVNGNEPIWIANFKRAIAAAFQIQAHDFGLLTVKEGTIHGFCDTEYLVTNHTSYYHIRKTVDLNSCPNVGGIHYSRSNIPANPCTAKTTRKVIVSNEAIYQLRPHDVAGVYVAQVTVKGFTMVNIFESTGSAQFINSELVIHYVKEKRNPMPISIDGTNMMLSSLEYVSHNKDPSAGRNTPTSSQQIKQIAFVLDYLTEISETVKTINFQDPIDGHVSEAFKVLCAMDLDSIHALYKDIDIGTSYRQETIRNIFLEIVPRIGTKASVIFTRDLVLNKRVRPATAVQLLIALPFHVDELSIELVQELEPFMSLGSNLPDVKQAGVLGFSTLIYNTLMAGKMRIEVFEKYVKKFFDYFLNSVDYEQQMLYVSAMANLAQGNVAEYFLPIIKADYPQNTDIRFLAIMATLPTAHTRPEKTYEIYWPMFQSRDTPLQLRIAALIMMLYSNPTPARLMSIHEHMLSETCPHILNYYVTTLQSLKKTTYPCYQQLREVIGFMSRHMPNGTNSRFWSTGSYLFDYIHESGIGGMFSSSLIADEKTDIPHIAMFDLKTEALGKYTGQMSLYIKARGVADIIEKNVLPMVENAGLRDILKALKLGQIPDTPLHVEIILKNEGKNVMIFYINQTLFDNIPKEDIMERLMAVVLGDTHINYQTIRWPFMNKYNVPTVLGTPAEVLIESTISTTVRGNITIPSNGNKIIRNQQIDLRYSSYSRCQSLSYNPFLNFEHQIKQEQGFLGYVPINIEMTLNIQAKQLALAFIRPANTETGFALKSKLSTGIYEFLLLGQGTLNGTQIIYEESEADLPITVFNHDIKDLGLNFEFDIGYNGLYRNLFNPQENWFVDKNLGGLHEEGHFRFIGNYILQLINIGHVTATHLGNNKYIKGVVGNAADSRIVALINLNYGEVEADMDIYAIELGLEQYDTLKPVAELPNHKWSGLLKVKKHPSSWKSTIQLIFKRITPDDEWRLCSENSYEPLIFTKKPETFNMTVMFGQMEPKTAKKCPTDKSRLQISGSFNIHADVEGIMGEMLDDVNEKCPKKTIYFNPPILKCDKFNTLTKVTDYHLNVKAERMPDWYNTNIRRLEQLYSSVTTGERSNWENEVDVKVKSPVGDRFMNLTINGVSTNVLDVANVFNSDHDIKHHSVDTTFEEYGLLYTCSVVGDKLLGYDNFQTDLSSHVHERNNKSCSILLAADCSNRHSFAIFLEPIQGSALSTKFGIRYFVGDTSVAISPDDKGHITVETFGAEKKKEVKDANFEGKGNYLQNTNFYYNDENILNIDHEIFKTKIQYEHNLLQLSTMFTMKNKVCGLCQPRPNVDVYSYCFR